jgi:hypothetical protein
VLENLSPSQLEGRLKNAAADFLQHRLIVPKIFLDAAWPSHRRIDVLAVDRAGAGDIHVAEAKASVHAIYDAVTNIMSLPAHYKYVVIFASPELRIDESRLYATDGMGRVGVIAVTERPADKSLQTHLVITPERFRLEDKYWKEVDAFLASSAPDVEIRDR